MAVVPPSAKPLHSHRREEILDQALKIMGVSGYQGLSVRDVAMRCGLSKQGVMHYFPTKDQLLVAILNERDASIEADLMALLQGGSFDQTSDPAVKRAILRGSLIGVLRQMLNTPNLIRLHVVLRAEAIDPSHPAHAFFLKRDAATLTWLAERLAPLHPNPVSKARQLLALLLGLQAQWLQTDQGFDMLDEWKRAIGDLLA